MDDGAHTLDSLIAELTRLRQQDHVPGNTIIVLAEDADGTGFSPLTNHLGVHLAMYQPKSAWSGTHYMREADRVLLSDADEYAPAPKDAVQAVFLWPRN